MRSASNFGSLASMQMKKRSLVASAKVGTLKTGWYGSGSPLSASMPSTAVRAAKRMVVSKAGGTKAGQLWKGLPPMFIGYSMAEAQYSSPYPASSPVTPPISTSSGSREWWKPRASESASIG